jgi:hypothetical protein
MATTTISATAIYEELKAASFKSYHENKDKFDWFPCGNAVVMLKSARGKLAQDFKKLGHAQTWYGKSGLSLNTYGHLGFASGGQSYYLNQEIAQAMVEVLESYGIEAYVHSWVD